MDHRPHHPGRVRGQHRWPAIGLVRDHAAGLPAQRRYRPASRQRPGRQRHLLRPVHQVRRRGPADHRGGSQRRRRCRRTRAASLVIALKPLAQRELSADQVTTELRAQARRHSRHRASPSSIRPPSGSAGAARAPPISTPCRAWIWPSCRTVSTRLMHAMQSDPTFVGVNSDHDRAAPSVQVKIDRDRAAALGRHAGSDRSDAGRWPLAASRCRRSTPRRTSIR